MVGLNFGQIKSTGGGGVPYFYLLIFIHKTD